MRIEDHEMSCGVRIAYELHPAPLQAALEIARALYDKAELDDDQTRSAALVIFSDQADRKSNGYRLAAMLRNLQCGTVTASEVRRNPNSGNRIRVWVWAPNHRLFAAWYRDASQKDAARRAKEAAAVSKKLLGYRDSVPSWWVTGY